MSSPAALRVAMTGSSGMIGSMLTPALTAAGHQVVRIVRKPPAPGEIRWDPSGAGLDPAALSGVDVVVHLAGENIGEGRWTAARKHELLESRQLGTRLLAESIARATAGPRALISASAIGYYGDRGDETLTEESGPGTGFLPEVCVAWESATAPAAGAGVRVAMVRTGLVLSLAGGVLQRMLPPFRLGLGGKLGDGEQWMSWISADDLVGAYCLAVQGALSGPVNAVAPEPVRNSEFTNVLAKALHRPALFAVPKTALRVALGQMADEAVLASTRVLPAALQRAGHRFEFPALAGALAHALEATR